jgi:hypothetical protein
MKFKTLLFGGTLLGLIIGAATTARADAVCCGDGKACCDERHAACCATDRNVDAVAVLSSIDRAAKVQPTVDAPARRTMEVRFQRPVKVGDRILLGKYVIEHDDVRMAGGRPCTHIYVASDQRLPVVAFRCTHLHNLPTVQDTVTVKRLREANGMTELLSFEFANERGAHGVPVVRPGR